MPKPGPFVMWSFVIGGPQFPAAVTHVGRNAIDLAVFAPEHRGIVPAQGSLHVSDPRAKNAPPDAGVWDFMESEKRLAALEASVASLIADLNGK
jgi:hypothetical protein